jgi:hypothetical protein
MLELAQKYAELKGTTIIPGAYYIAGDTITFVMESGPKLTMTRADLEAATSTAPTAAPTAPPADDGGSAPKPPKKKGKKK